MRDCSRQEHTLRVSLYRVTFGPQNFRIPEDRQLMK
jgi:hypothetical protein